MTKLPSKLIRNSRRIQGYPQHAADIKKAIPLGKACLRDFKATAAARGGVLTLDGSDEDRSLKQ
jgi:hypothetical protein